MADGTVFKFGHNPGVGLVALILGDWQHFDGWCASQNIDPLDLPSRRMISLMMYYFERDLDEEQREEFRTIISNMLLSKTKAPPARRLKAVEEPRTKVVGKGKWRAPEGWKPPNWDEERSYRQAQGFMSFQRNPSK